MTVPRLHIASESPSASSPEHSGPRSAARLGSIEVPVRVELGRSELLLSELARLGRGSVVRLNTQTDEPVDLVVSGRVFARGEIVVMDDHMALRVTGVLDAER